ncbi:MAG: PAS domain S-box protein, partial [Euryarchaeota archaeon]|nr:PAS domain S-box protein [Euryarchaeota archaeon]
MDDEDNNRGPALSYSFVLRKKLRTSRKSWSLIPIILILIAVLAIIGEDAVWNPSGIIPILNIVFITPISILISILAARSYLRQRSLAVLFLGCGTLALGTGAALTMVPSIASVGNSIVTMYSTSIILAAFCHLLSTISLSSSSLKRPKYGWPVLVISYVIILAAVAILLGMVLNDFWPDFFVAGSGQTNLGYVFLMSAVVTFLVSALLLWINRGDDKGGFYYHYSAGLVLIAVGLTGVSLQSSLGDPLNWVGRSSQYAGIVFMLLAVISSVEHSGTWTLPMEKALRDSESRYQSLVALSPNAILVLSEGRLIFANPAAVRLFGVGSSRDMIGKDVTELTHLDHLDRTVHNLKKMQENVILPPWESKFIRSDGSSIDVEVTGSRVGFGDNLAVQVILRDVTEHKRSDDALKESESKYRGLFENIQEAVVLRKIIYDEHGEIVDLGLVDANPVMLKIIGVESIDDVKGKRFSDLYDPETAAWALEHVRTMMAAGGPFAQESHHRVNDRYYITTSVPLGNDLTFSTGIDMTDRKMAEEALRESNEYLEQLIGYANAPIIVWDRGCIITRFNHAFEVLTGISANEAVGSELSMLFPQASRGSSMELIRHAMEGTQWDVVEIPIQHRSGQIRAVVWNS